MKVNYKNTTLVIVICSVLITQACKKIKPLKNDIDYPAAYIINGESNTISVIDIITDEVKGTATFKKGTWPHHIYANSDKSKVVVSLTGMDLSGGHSGGHGGGHGKSNKTYIMTLNAKTLALDKSLKTDVGAHNAIFVNTDTEIWLPQIKTDGTIKILEASTLKEKSNISVGNTPLEITLSNDKKYAFVANNAANSISVIDISSKKLVKTIMVGKEPVGAWPGSNNKMYVDCEASKQIFEIDAISLIITDTISLLFTPAYAAYNSKTKQLWISDAEFGRVHIYNNTSGNWIESSFIITGNNAHAIAFNKEETKAYITNQGAASVSVIDAITLSKTKDIAVGNKPNGILIIE